MPLHDLPAAAPRRWTAFAVVLAGMFLANMTVFIVVVALPSIGAQLGASGAQQQLILAGYELVYAVGLISGGRLGDMVGQFRVFGAGMAVFTVASAGCALAPSTSVLVAARLVQGAGTALMVPQVYSLARSLFGDRSRPRAFALIGVVMGAGVIAGQAAGGLLVTADPLGVGWRAVFWINLPVGAAALAALPVVAGRTRRTAARAGADLPGMTLAGLALFMLVLPLTMGREWSWPWWTAVMVLASVPLAWLFVRRQRRLEAGGRSPLVPPSLVRRTGVGQGLAMIAVFNSGLTVFFWLLALYLQRGRGLDAAGTGLVMVPVALAFIGASLLAPWLFPGRSGRAVVLGAAVTALGYEAIAAVPVPPIPVLGAILAVTGAGQGLAITPMLGIALQAVPERQAGAGAGLAATAQQLGAALGVCLFGLFFYGIGGTTASAFRATVALLPVTALAAALISRRLSGSPDSRWCRVKRCGQRVAGVLVAGAALTPRRPRTGLDSVRGRRRPTRDARAQTARTPRKATGGSAGRPASVTAAGRIGQATGRARRLLPARDLWRTPFRPGGGRGRRCRGRGGDRRRIRPGARVCRGSRWSTPRSPR